MQHVELDVDQIHTEAFDDRLSDIYIIVFSLRIFHIYWHLKKEKEIKVCSRREGGAKTVHELQTHTNVTTDISRETRNSHTWDIFRLKW